MATDPWAQFADAPSDTAPAADNDPWAQFADAPSDAAPEAPAQAAPDAPSEKPQGWLEGLKWEIQNPSQSLSPKNVMSAAVRPAVKAATAIPGMFADAAVAGYNMLRPQTVADQVSPGAGNMQLPSESLNNLIDRFTTKPTGLGKGAELVSTTLLGSKIPAPQMGKEAPKDFVRPSPELTPTQQVFKSGREAGYVVPPSTVKPSTPLQLAESLGGKIATGQKASAQNQAVTNKLIRKELGLPENAHLTREVLSKVRSEAGKAYGEVEQAGRITADAQYADELKSLMSVADDIAKDFPDANVGATDQIGALVKTLQRESFDSKSAMAYLKELRNQAKGNLSPLNAADPAKKALGSAQREAAGVLEDQVIRHLQAQGKGDLAERFDKARVLIAKTHSVENALNPATGDVVARQLATQLRKNKPLSGGIKQAAEFASAFPKASQQLNDSGPVSALDSFVVGGGVATLNPSLVAWPFARIGARNSLLSDVVQNRLLPSSKNVNALARAPYVMGGAAAADQMRR